MRRDPALRDLSSEHHSALVFAKRLRQAAADGFGPEELAAIRRFFERELLPHFEQEERCLLPALERAGERSLVQRTRDDHRDLRRQAGALDSAAALERLAETLKAHVRFEERELFDAAQRVLSEEELRQLVVCHDRPADSRERAHS